MNGPGSPIQDRFNDGIRERHAIYFRTGSSSTRLIPTYCTDLYVYSNGHGFPGRGAGVLHPNLPEPDSRFKAESSRSQHVFFSTTKWIDPVYGHGNEDDLLPYETSTVKTSL